MSCLGLLVEGMTGGQDGDVFSGMAQSRAHITDATVGMVMVIPMDEGSRPGACGFQIGKAPFRELRPVFGGAKERFHEGVVVADARP